MLEFAIFTLFADADTNLYISGKNIEELETLETEANETCTSRGP